MAELKSELESARAEQVRAETLLAEGMRNMDAQGEELWAARGGWRWRRFFSGIGAALLLYLALKAFAGLTVKLIY